MTTPDPYGQINPGAQPTSNPQYPGPAAPLPTQQAYGVPASSIPPPQQEYGNPAYAVSPAQQGYGYQPPAPQMAQRNTLVFVVSIIMIFGGAFGFISNLVSAGVVISFFGGLGVLAVILGVGVTAAEIAGGVLGALWASTPSKGQLLFTVGLVLLGLAIVMMIVNLAVSGIGFTAILGLTLPVLFLVGAQQMRQSVR